MKKNKIKKYYISIFILLISVFNLNAAIFFDLKNEYISSKENIYLKDIIVISDMNSLSENDIEVYNRELKDIFICYAPFKKESKTISSNVILEKLKRLKIKEFTPYQNRNVTIKNNYKYFKSNKQKEIIENRINELFSVHNKNETEIDNNTENLTKFKYKIKNNIKTIRYPVREKISIKLKEKDNRVRLSGNQLFTIEIRLDDRLFKRIMVNTFIKTYKKVLVTKRKLPMNLPLHKTNFFLEEREITGMENEVISDFSELEKYKTAKLILQKKIVKRSYLKMIPDINRGQTVDLYYKNDSISLTIAGTAMNNCFIGEKARFRSVANPKKILYCKIIDEKTAVVQ